MKNHILARDPEGFDILHVWQGAFEETDDLNDNVNISWGDVVERISGSLWSDSESPQDMLAILIRHRDRDTVKRDLEDAGFYVEVSSDMIREAMPIAEVVNFGDGQSGTVEIVRLSDSWVVIGD